MFNTKEQHTSQEETRQNIINDMVKKRNSIVPVIGEDTVVYQDPDTGKEIPFQEFILQGFQKKYPHVEVSKSDIASMKERGYYGLSLMSQYNERQFFNNIMDFVNDNRPCIKLKNEVLDFLVTFNFPIIITTICFDIIEQQLKGKIEKYDSIWYRLNKDNKTSLDNKRCVYHIFGQAKDCSKWVYDEDCLLTFLLSHNDKDYGATGLTDYLKEKRLFILGCNLPNWLFRFLWQPTQVDKKDSFISPQGYWINEKKPEDSFEYFLKKKDFSADEQVKEILVDATKLLKEKLAREAKERSSMIDTEEHFDVFISYASEDRQIATAIFEALKNMNVKVWFDDRGKGEITPGQKYWERIENGIKHSAHFMSVITGNWREKMTSTSSLKEETFKAHNWLNECGKPDSFVRLKDYSIPVVIEGSMHNGVIITDTNIEAMGNIGIISPLLFSGIHIITFNEKDFSVFEKIEW